MVFVNPAPRTLRIHCVIYLGLVFAIVAGLAVAPHSLAQSEPPAPLIQVTEPPPPPPTVPPPPPTAPPPPPTDLPPPPTAVPTTPPTAPPPPTEQPTGEATEPPTEVPATTVPAPPDLPQQQQPPPPPRIQPTQPPAATQPPNDATIDCDLVDAANPPIAGDADWSLYDCMFELDFGQLASIDIQGMTETPGWRVILVDLDAPDTPGLLDASNNRIVLDDLENAAAAHFMLGVRLSCTAFTATELEFEIAGARVGASTPIETIATLPITAESVPIPELTLESFAFTDTTGDIVVRYDNAPTTCGWQLLMTFGGADTGQPEALAIVSVDGSGGTTTSLANGAISILFPAPDAESSSVGGAHVVISIGDGLTIETILVEAFTSP